MSIEAVRAFEQYSAARRSTFNVGHQLAWYAQQHTGLAWPTDEQLMAACRISERQLHRSLRWLEQAGEIVREAPAPGRRRVYRVTPQPDTVAGSTCHPGRFQPDTVAGKPANRARVLTAVTKTLNSTPPTPQGGSAPDLIAALAEPPVLLVAGVDPLHRPRRKRDRDALDAALLEGCPGPENGAAREEWAGISERVRERIGDQAWGIWLSTAHPHRLHGDTLVVALSPQSVEWVHDRFGQVIHQVAKRPVALVGCTTLGARR